MSNQVKNAISIKELLENDNYIIPIYQRNYAWGKSEITQLIRDIYEFFENDKAMKADSDKNYYIGSLVCFKRDDGSFELIDGQQRHTTITLINLYLKNLNSGIARSNLKFDSRKNAQKFIESFSNSDNLGYNNIPGTENLKSAIDTIKEELQDKNIELFIQYFYNNVKLFRVEVPEDTDLNHYFEILNNRGEQLEKHEIVKAKLMGRITNRDDQETFALVWDACSDMSNYIYFKFEGNKDSIFTREGEFKLENTQELFEKFSTTSQVRESQKETLYTILEQHELRVNCSQEDVIIAEKYKSIINFQNFLLQVLKLLDDSVTLDDKNLLVVFESKIIDPKEFIFELLKLRCIFDKFIIKQNLSDSDESKQNWVIRCLYDYKVDVENTYKDNHKELVMLQSMLFYSTINNNWLHQILRDRLYQQGLNVYISELFQNIVKNRFDRTKLKYPEVTTFNLYFIDFLLWKLYKTIFQDNLVVNGSLQNLKLKIENKKEMFNSFRFKQLNSKEHLLPQSRVNDGNKVVLNEIGNLCLISVSQNSSGNNDHPKFKKQRFGDDNSSLKRQVMFGSFDKDWDKPEIDEHSREINDLIDWYLNV